VERPQDVNLAATFRTWWALLVVLTVAGAVAGFVVSSAMTPVYKGTASVLVGDFDNGEVNNNEIQAMQSLTATYADIGRREPVLSGAAQDLGLGNWRELRKSVHVVVPKESPQVIEVSVEGSNRSEVQRAAGAIADRLLEYVDPTSGASDFVTPQLRRLEDAIKDSEDRLDELRAEQKKLGTDAPDSLNLEIRQTQTQIAAWQNNYAAFKELRSTSSQIAIRELDHADAARTPVRPDTRFNTLIGGFVGLLLGLAIVYLFGVGRSPSDIWRRERPGRRPDAAEGRAPDGPVIEPVMAPVTPPVDVAATTIPINGHSVRPAVKPDRAAHRPEGEARWASSRR